MGINDPMQFEIVRDNIESLLIANETGLFRTVSGQKLRIDAEEVKGILRSVQIFYESGEYTDEKSGKQQKEHECEYRLEYKLSSAATADLTILNNPDAPAVDYQTALASATDASRIADHAMDAFRRIISQILLDPKNRGAFLTPVISSAGTKQYGTNRLKLKGFRKNQPLRQGSLIVLTASETFTTTVTETFDGADVVTGADSPITMDTGMSNADGDPDDGQSNLSVDN